MSQRLNSTFHRGEFTIFSATQVNFKPTPAPYTGARIELPAPRDPLVFAREELASYMAFARALPHNWHYKTCTPVTNGILGCNG